MTVNAGSRIGPYEIVSPLRSGGMGDVYRGLDTKLNRPVAVKFISERLADRNARRRFQREAQTASSLNHPHILTVYDAGEHAERQYLVTEFIDGGTLDEWIRAEKRSWRQVVELLVGVADGLATAHSAGILHRDIKPPNILVTKNGYAKLADFGLAKAIESPPDQELTIGQETHAGVVVGTIAYMSPEQAAGRPLDARSDIFSFGIVLYEALTGRRPFSGASDLEVLQRVIHQPAPPLPADLPIGLRIIVEKALENDPADRYQSMRELVVDLRRLTRQKTTDSAVAETRSAGRRWWTAIIAVTLAFVAGVSAPLLWQTAPSATEGPLASAVFTRLTNFEGTERSAAISPDGKFVAYRADRDGPLDVWVGQIGSGRFANLTQGIDDEYATDTPSVGFSGDGSEIWLSGGVGRRLRLLPLMGGPPRVFLPDGTVSVAWSPDGNHVVYHLQDDGDSMFVADRTGSNQRQIFRQSPGRHNHFPVWSRDGQWIYFTSGTPVTREMDMWRIRVAGGSPERMTTHSGDVSSPAPVDSRTVIYTAPDRDGSGPWLWALDTVRKVSRRLSFGVEKYLSVTASADGHRLVATVANPGASLWSVPILADRQAEEPDVKPFALPTSDASAPQFGGMSLFYLSSLSAGAGVWRLDGKQALEIWKGSDGSVMAPPAVSRDGRNVAIVLRREGKLRLHTLSADGAELKAVADTIDVRGGAAWSPDGKWIVVGGNDNAGSPGLFKVPGGGGAATRVVAGVAINPIWSPDGNLIVYAGQNVSAFQPLLAVRPDGMRVELPPIRVRRDGERARFLPDGKALIYMQRELRSQDFWLLDLTGMKTRPLTRLTRHDPMRTFDITPDGQRIVFDRLRENSDIVLIDIPK
jgi:Tol biopolymer transport system component/predicted Ser/Thr protein kinase